MSSVQQLLIPAQSNLNFDLSTKFGVSTKMLQHGDQSRENTPQSGLSYNRKTYSDDEETENVSRLSQTRVVEMLSLTDWHASWSANELVCGYCQYLRGGERGGAALSTSSVA